jgi:hypothetical protein
MATIDFELLTIPTPEPYDAAHPTRQLENLCFVALQFLWQAKQAAWTESDAVSSGGGAETSDLVAKMGEMKTSLDAFASAVLVAADWRQVE